jgi:hypothetical protein
MLFEQLNRPNSATRIEKQEIAASKATKIEPIAYRKNLSAVKAPNLQPISSMPQ